MKTKAFLSIIMLIASVSLASEEGIKDLHRDIVLLNLINGLYLTPSQTQQLLSKLYEAKALRESYQKEMEKREKFLKTVFTELRSQLMENKTISRELIRRVHRAEKVVEEMRMSYQQRLCSLESEVISLLTENQLYLIENFKPCLIPPKHGTIGQMPGQAPGPEALLDRVRKAPEWRFQRHLDRLLEMHIDRLERKIGVMSDEEKQAEKERVRAILEKARSLPEVDFQLQKPQLAQEIIEHEPPKPRRKKGELGKVGRFLLDERLIPILESRLSREFASSVH